jgi:hypothetical protein
MTPNLTVDDILASSRLTLGDLFLSTAGSMYIGTPSGNQKFFFNDSASPLTIIIPVGVYGSHDHAASTYGLLLERTDSNVADGYYTAADISLVLDGGSSATYLGARNALHARVRVYPTFKFSGSVVGVKGQIDMWGTAVSTGAAIGMQAELSLWAASSGFSLTSFKNFHAKGIDGGGATKPVTTIYGFYAESQYVTGVTTGYGFYAAGSSDANYFAGSHQIGTTLYVVGNSGFGKSSPSTRAHTYELVQLAGAALTDGYAGALTLESAYDDNQVIGAIVTRHNYINVKNVALTNSAAVTDAAVMRFDANAGTHKAVDSGTTKTSPGTVTEWLKINVNGAVHYIPAYSSKTS